MRLFDLKEDNEEDLVYDIRSLSIFSKTNNQPIRQGINATILPMSPQASTSTSGGILFLISTILLLIPIIALNYIYININ